MRRFQLGRFLYFNTLKSCSYEIKVICFLINIAGIILCTYFRSCDNTLKNCFFQIFSYSHAYVGILAKGEAGNSFEN